MLILFNASIPKVSITSFLCKYTSVPSLLQIHVEQKPVCSAYSEKADRLQSIFDLFVCLVFTFSYIIIRNCLIFFMPFSSPQFIHVSTSLNPYLSFSSGISKSIIKRFSLHNISVNRPALILFSISPLISVYRFKINSKIS